MKIFSSSRLYFLNILIYGAVKLVCILFIFLCKVFHQVIIIFNDLILSSKLFLINKKKNKLVNKRKKNKVFWTPSTIWKQNGIFWIYKKNWFIVYISIVERFLSFIHFFSKFVWFELENPKSEKIESCVKHT